MGVLVELKAPDPEKDQGKSLIKKLLPATAITATLNLLNIAGPLNASRAALK